MKIIVRKANDRGPRNRVAEVELVLDGALDGLRLVGLDVWRKRDGDLFVAFPGRQYEKDGQKKTWDYLRAADRDDMRPMDRLKSAILAKVRAEVGADEDRMEDEEWS